MAEQLFRVRNTHPHGDQVVPALFGLDVWPYGETREIPLDHAYSLTDGGDYEAVDPLPKREREPVVEALVTEADETDEPEGGDV